MGPNHRNSTRRYYTSQTGMVPADEILVPGALTANSRWFYNTRDPFIVTRHQERSPSCRSYHFPGETPPPVNSSSARYVPAMVFVPCPLIVFVFHLLGR